MKFLQNLKTSDKITFLFIIFNFIGLIILLLGVNLSYFLFWTSNQKEMSLSKIDAKYEEFKIDKDLEKFREFVLRSDTIIIPEDENNEIFCSKGVEKKVHESIITMREKFYYISGDQIYFIFSKDYDAIGEVKILLNISSYLNLQFFIIKVSLFLIFISLFIFYFIGKKITKYSFKDLEKISKKAIELDIDKDFKEIDIAGNKFDEINILTETINKSFLHIKKQTGNLKQFTNDVAHEFKTPLMVINSKIDLYNKKLQKNSLKEADTNNLLNDIKKNIKKLNTILETFLYLTRIENNIENFEKREVNIAQYLENFTNNYISENQLESKNIEIKYIFDKNIKLNIEENTFNILFGNLLSNAIKFSPTNKKIDIGVNKNSFWIKDNGIGIKKEDINNIWDKFFRIDQKIEGFGIGLFLVKRLITLYNWKIDIESEEKKSTKFIIYF